MSTCTIQNIIPDGTYHYRAPFLVVKHEVRDIGLVGWKNNRWTHQDKECRTEDALALQNTGIDHESRTDTSAEWKQAFDPSSLRYYFYNASEGVTSWEPPDQSFTADATVQYYIQKGIARPWDQECTVLSRRVGTIPYQSVHFEDVAAMQDAVGHRDPHVPTDPEENINILTPASIRFSPSKKGELPRNVERYWVLRYSLFSRWSHGVVLNEKSLFSVTPEVIAKHHAKMLNGGGTVLDAFCGCGGNTIHLAGVFETVRVLLHSKPRTCGILLHTVAAEAYEPPDTCFHDALFCMY